MRLFIALPLPQEIVQFLGNIVADFRQKPGKVKWVNPKNIHLTLKFLGETDNGKVEAISRSIKNTAGKHPSINNIIDKIGGFPNLRRPKVIWAGLTDNIDKLEDLASDIDSEMTELGFEKETRKFKSHLTLGRVKDNRDMSDLAKYLESYQIQPMAVLFDKIVLFKSTLTPAGPIYERMFEAGLGQHIFE